MADIRATVSVANLRKDDIRVKTYEGRESIYVELGGSVDVSLGHDRADAGAEAAAMRELSRVAAEVAAELERRAAAGKEGSDV